MTPFIKSNNIVSTFYIVITLIIMVAIFLDIPPKISFGLFMLIFLLVDVIIWISSYLYFKSRKENYN